MAEGITYLCPGCGAYLRYDGGQGKWVCDYCDSSYTKEELEQRGAKTENSGYTVSSGDSGDFLRVLRQSYRKPPAVQRKISSLGDDSLCNG